MIIRVVTDDGERRWNRRAGEGATGFDPVARQIIGVAEIADDRGTLLIRQAREFRGGVGAVVMLLKEESFLLCEQRTIIPKSLQTDASAILQNSLLSALLV